MICRRILVLVLAVVPVLGAPVASAQKATNAPPGLSAVDQYLETVPDAGGPRTVAGGRKPDLAAPGAAVEARRVLGAAAVAALGREGQDGRDAAALAASAAPAAARPGARTANPAAAPGAAPATPGAGASSAPEADRGGGEGRLAVVSRIATGSGDGMGMLFPVLIVLGAAAVGGGALWRRWSTPG